MGQEKKAGLVEAGVVRTRIPDHVRVDLLVDLANSMPEEDKAMSVALRMVVIAEESLMPWSLPLLLRSTRGEK